MTPNQLKVWQIIDEAFTPTSHTHDLTVVFTDGTDTVFPAVESSWIDNNVLRLRCRDAGKSSVYALPLVGIRMWHRELT